MSKELETRVINIDVDSIRNKLKELGATLVKSEDQINDLYDFEDMKLRKEKGYARIRTVNDRINDNKVIFMTTKKMLSQGTFKEMEEYETIVENKTMAEGIYKALGLKLNQSIKKYRESYKLNNSLVEIDINDPKFCPFPYIEIETSSIENLNETLHLLGYTIEDTTSKTIYELIKEYKKTNNLL